MAITRVVASYSVLEGMKLFWLKKNTLGYFLSCKLLCIARVARWFVFKPKIIILGKFWSAFEW
jgi:hypothetical protein